MINEVKSWGIKGWDFMTSCPTWTFVGGMNTDTSKPNS